jgi:hypothetical protein
MVSSEYVCSYIYQLPVPRSQPGVAVPGAARLVCTLPDLRLTSAPHWKSASDSHQAYTHRRHPQRLEAGVAQISTHHLHRDQICPHFIHLLSDRSLRHHDPPSKPIAPFTLSGDAAIHRSPGQKALPSNLNPPRFRPQETKDHIQTRSFHSKRCFAFPSLAPEELPLDQVSECPEQRSVAPD